MTGPTIGSTDVDFGGGSRASNDKGKGRAPEKDGVHVERRVVDAVTVVTLIGDLDARTAPKAQQLLASALPKGAPALLDLSEVNYVSSAGLRTMLMVYRQAQLTDTPIVLVGVSPVLRSILSATGFLRFFDVADTVPDAIATLRAG